MTTTETATIAEEPYKYAHLLPHFSPDKYPPLIPFEHVDPGHRALKHADPRAFLNDAASVIALTPNLGTEVRGIRLTDLDSDGRDQLALETIGRYTWVDGLQRPVRLHRPGTRSLY